MDFRQNNIKHPNLLAVNSDWRKAHSPCASVVSFAIGLFCLPFTKTERLPAEMHEYLRWGDGELFRASFPHLSAHLSLAPRRTQIGICKMRCSCSSLFRSQLLRKYVFIYQMDGNVWRQRQTTLLIIMTIKHKHIIMIISI